MAVVVVVGGRDAHAVAVVGDAGGGGDVGVATVGVAAIEAVGGLSGGGDGRVVSVDVDASASAVVVVGIGDVVVRRIGQSIVAVREVEVEVSVRVVVE
ncbi:MAG: hypothetical protein IPG72_00200 [Ardenticatenales bacterium]|nr:hypothetical protein [Ardenticatenales bacterium]